MAAIEGPAHEGQRVSVVVPCRDAGPHLEQALCSALDQEHPPLEVIVVDDGSTDASLAVALAVRARHPDRVRVLAEVSGNAARTRNIGASVARGDALLFLDADDVLAPDAIASLVRALPAGGLAVCPWSRLEHRDDTWARAPATCRRRRRGQDPLAAWLTGWWHPPCSVLWTREAFERAGRWDELCTVDDDGDLVMRALAAGLPLGASSSGHAFYRRAASGTSSLSGTQCSEPGLRSRLRVVQKVEAALEERGRVASYRAALRHRLAGIVADARAGGHAAVVLDASVARARLGSPLVRVREVAVRAGRGLRWSLGIGRPRAARVDAGSPVAVPCAGGVAGFDRATTSSAPERATRPTVSVVLPTHQRAGSVRRAIDSVLSQSFTDLELIVVDDGSTDGTRELLAEVGDPRLRVLHQGVNQGVSAARNRALREARGDLVAFIDSDDTWLPGKLEAQVEAMAALPATVGILYGGVEDVDEHGAVRARTPTHRGDLHAVLARRNVVHGTSGVVMRRAVVAAVGFFDEDIPAIEDWDLWFRASRLFTFEFLAPALVRYADAAAADRKTMQRDQNHRARDHFHAKHRRSLRALGTEHLFLVDSARRRLVHSGDVAGARRVARRALVAAPLDGRVLRMLLRTHLRPSPSPRPRWAGVEPTEGAPAAGSVLLHCAVDMSEAGGVQTVFRRLREGLAGRGYGVEQSWNRRTGPCPPDESTATVVRLALPERRGSVAGTARSVVSAARTFVVLAGLVRRTRPVIVNVHYAHAGLSHFLWLRSLFRFRLVVSVHGSDVLKATAPAARARLERHLAAADAVTTVSAELTEQVLGMGSVDPRRVRHVPNGIDLDFWCERPRHARADPRPTVLNVGRLRPDHKGQDVLLRAFVGMRAAVPDARLVLVGEGPAETELRRLAVSLGVAADVVFAGAVPSEELRTLLGLSDVFVLASRREGLPVSLLEAMATGVPPVVTAVGSMAEVVGDDGVVVAPDDPDALAAATIELLRDPARACAMGRRARARAAAYAADAVDEAYDQLFRSLLAAPGRGPRHDGSSAPPK